MALTRWNRLRPGRIGLTLLLAALATGCKPSRLNEDMVRDMINTGLQATANRNATVLCDQIADDADIRLVVFKFSGSDIRTFSKAQWCDYLREGFSKAEMPGMTINVHMNIESLQIASDGKSADVSAEVLEEVGVGGRSLVRMSSKQTFSVEMRKGKPKYVKLSARYTA
ncbi:hypothetical protein OU995_01575 [Roseateles sp. SL47]|uniref:hypothetical protein n=1 Tax=Roseateles sp. SL47 TaxID=2995138 RepID=UPI0022722889|nr:hypothetical protein [Roseateles sp. SL47]WAC73466.1 hypothetical protein OU995_01575 [Roseateles sp. SL47]